MMRTTRRTAIALTFAVASLALAAPAQAAVASSAQTDLATTDTEAAFHDFVVGLDLPSAKRQQIENYFASLPEASQEAGIADPSTLFTISEVSSTVRQLPATSAGGGRVVATAAAGTRTLQVNNRQARVDGRIYTA